MIANLVYRRLVGWVLWALLLLSTVALLTQRHVVGVSQSAAATLAIAGIWAATIAPNMLRSWTHPGDGEDSSTLRLQRKRAVWRRSLAAVCGALGAAAILFWHPVGAGGISWFTVVQGGACTALAGYAIGDHVLPDLLKQWGARDDA